MLPLKLQLKMAVQSKEKHINMGHVLKEKIWNNLSELILPVIQAAVLHRDTFLSVITMNCYRYTCSKVSVIAV